MKDATSIATVKGPDWLADTGGFAVLTTDTPGVLRLIVNDDESICVRAKAWTCHRLALATMDELHPGLPPTDRRLSKTAAVHLPRAGHTRREADARDRI